MDFKTHNDIYSDTTDFICELAFLTADEGGRTEIISDIYRPLFKIQGLNELTSADVSFLNTDVVVPGDKVEAMVRIIWTAPYEGKLAEQLDFVLREGAQIVAKGVITKVLNEKLKQISSS